MRRPEFSEFSYGFALTQEICSHFSLIEAPAFPSLLEEGTQGGHDVHIPAAALFLQFKRAYQLRKRNAGEFHLFNEPYFRSYLHRRDHSKQHRLLLELEGTGRRVLYAAPIFRSTADLNHHYSSGTVATNTIFFRPSSIGPLADNDQHYVVFVQPAFAYFCSKPSPLQGVTLEREIITISRVPSETPLAHPPEGVVAFAAQLVEDLSSTYSRATRTPVPRGGWLPRIEHPLLRAAILSRLLFDSELSVVGVA